MSIKRKLILITLLFSCLIMVLMGANLFAMRTLSTVRAYVGGEAFWSKGQKDAIYYLARYNTYHNEKDFFNFQENLKIPLADRVARLELEKENSDFAIVEAAFIRGGNHPDDVRSMAYLFKSFHWLSYLKQTIANWTLGDLKIIELQSLGKEIHNTISQDKMTNELNNLYHQKIEHLNAELTILEANYSYALGKAVRWLTEVLFFSTITTALIFLALALWLSFMVFRNIMHGIETLKIGTERIEQGIFDAPVEIRAPLHSKDELVQLAISFNHMTRSLLKAITERNAANEKLTIKARQLSEAQEIAHIGSWELDLDTMLITASDEFYQILGLFPEEIILTPEYLLSKVAAADREMITGVFSQVFRDKKTFRYDHKLTQNGVVKILSIEGKPVLDSTGKIKKIIGSAQDITDRFKIHNQMIQSSKMASLGEMASGIAHEINNPLTIIKLATAQVKKNLSAEKPDQKLTQTAVARIDATVDRISKIIQGLRIFSRDGKQDPFELISVENLLDDVLSFCSERLKHNSIKLIKEINPNLFFEGRHTEISQVLLNLLNNSIDAIENDTEKWIEIRTWEDEEFLEIRVTDSGKGISPEIQNKIFQPFYTSKEIGKGTGLGLSLSLTIVKNHFGELYLDNQKKHTTFVIRLPKKRISH